MGEILQSILGRVAALPPELLYLVIGVGAAVENIFPPVPADTFVLLGAFIAGLGRASLATVFIVTLVGNVATALAVYGVSRRYGPGFFRTRVGSWVLHPGQLEQISGFYARFGTIAIFFSRFLPGLRAVVPVFAGVTRVPFWRVVLPLASASAVWYGVLIYIGAVAGRNWSTVVAWLDRASGILTWIALPLIAGAVWWWIRSRRRHRRA